MTAALTLALYITRQFIIAGPAMTAALTGLTSLFDFIELLRRAATHTEATFSLVVEIAALRLPYLLLQVIPFAVLLGGMLAFWRLTRSSELIVARAAGVSAWQFLSAPVLCALAIGGICTMAVSPISSVLFERAETLSSRYLSTGGGPLELAHDQLWLRQADHGLVPDGVAIIHANDVSLRRNTLSTRSLTVFRLDPEDRLLTRIDAAKATLAPGKWILDGALTLHPDALPQPDGRIILPTDLTVDRVQESFASPDTLSVWELPGFIRLLNRSGFSSISHRLHFQALLSLPLLCATMALVAAGFSMRPARRGGVARMIGSGVAAGFALFMISKMAEQFGQSGAMPVMLAAWAPAAAGLMLAVALLLHVEDG